MSARSLSRRTALGSALAAPVVLAACDIDPPQPAGTSADTTSPPPEDAELVAAAVAELVRASAVLEAAGQAVPSLDARLEPALAAHATHVGVLSGAVSDSELPTAAPVTVPDAIIPALRVVRRSEQRLLRHLREACVSASSGDLARVLASAAASTSQHAAALTPEVTG